MCYVALWRKFIDDELYYFAINNPKKYSEEMINDFNKKYESILLNGKYMQTYIINIKKPIIVWTN